MRAGSDGAAALEAGLRLLPGTEPPTFREVLFAGGTRALRDLLTAWGRDGEAVVWDGDDQSYSLADFLARI